MKYIVVGNVQVISECRYIYYFQLIDKRNFLWCWDENPIINDEIIIDH